LRLDSCLPLPHAHARLAKLFSLQQTVHHELRPVVFGVGRIAARSPRYELPFRIGDEPRFVRRDAYGLESAREGLRFFLAGFLLV
jgi:hypothetical protein